MYLHWQSSTLPIESQKKPEMFGTKEENFKASQRYSDALIGWKIKVGDILLLSKQACRNHIKNIIKYKAGISICQALNTGCNSMMTHNVT